MLYGIREWGMRQGDLYMNRIFIIAPTDEGVAVGDTLHVVASTKCRDSLLDIYQTDRYEEVGRFGSKAIAVKFAKRLGAKRPTVI